MWVGGGIGACIPDSCSRLYLACCGIVGGTCVAVASLRDRSVRWEGALARRRMCGSRRPNIFFSVVWFVIVIRLTGLDYGYAARE